MTLRRTLSVRTQGRGSVELTGAVDDLVRESGVVDGSCELFIHHTSASLMLCENADPQVRADLETFLERLVPDGDPMFEHTSEGADDMPAHVRSVLTQSSMTIPVIDAHCDLGTWQGIYLLEHRLQGHARRVTVTVRGLDGRSP